MAKIRTSVASFFAVFHMPKALASGLLAAVTTAAGGSATINDGTPVALSLFVGGICVSCAVGLWVGKKVGQLLDLFQAVRRIMNRMDKVEDRITRLEKEAGEQS